MAGHCSRSTCTVIPTEPGASLFDTTFNNAEPSRSTTSSIVAGAHFCALTIAFGTPAALAPDRSATRLQEAPRGVLLLRSAAGRVVTQPSGTTRSSDFC